MLNKVEFCCRRTAHPSGVGNGSSADDNRTYTSLAFNIVTSLSLDAFTAPLLAASGDASNPFFSADVLSANGNWYFDFGTSTPSPVPLPGAFLLMGTV